MRLRYLDHVVPRNINELYIPYLAADRERSENFFPPKDVPFDLLLPDGTWISAKVCQNAFAKVSDAKYAQMGPDEQAKEDKRRRTGKAIMSNPNSVLGKWILRDVLELPEGQVITYDMLRQYGIDSVIFTRIDDGKYAVDKNFDARKPLPTEVAWGIVRF